MGRTKPRGIFHSLIDIFLWRLKVSRMKPNQPQQIDSCRNYITLTWENCDSAILSKITEPDCLQEEGNEERKWWYVLERKDRVLGWSKAYVGFKTQVKVGPLPPGDYYEFRLKVTSGKEDSKWSDTLFAVTKDDFVPVAQLHRVVNNGPVATLRRILILRPSIVDVPNKFQQTPLTLATLKNNTNFMGILLNNGADIDGPELGSRRTPLMTAAQRGQIDAVQLLLEKGSSWETRDRNGLTALNYAVDNSQLDTVQLAVENGADVKVRDRFGWTSLLRGVILKSSLNVLTYLLENGSDPNEADDTNQTALMQAVLSGRAEVVELLLEKGADINARNIYGHSAYDMAKCSSSDGILRIMHLLGNEPEDEGKKQMKRAASGRRPKAVKRPSH